MFKYLVPRIVMTDLPAMIWVSLVGAALAGVYGAIHDQFTYSISPEYFTKLKFDQFRYANFGLGDRVFVATIGFLATWWVGFIVAWFIARRLIPDQPRQSAYRQIAQGFLCVAACGVLGTLIGYGYGLWRGPGADHAAWNWAIQQFAIHDINSFVRVALIHNSSYAGGLIGLVAALVLVRPPHKKSLPPNSQS